MRAKGFYQYYGNAQKRFHSCMLTGKPSPWLWSPATVVLMPLGLIGTLGIEGPSFACKLVSLVGVEGIPRHQSNSYWRCCPSNTKLKVIDMISRAFFHRLWSISCLTVTVWIGTKGSIAIVRIGIYFHHLASIGGFQIPIVFNLKNMVGGNSILLARLTLLHRAFLVD